MFKRYGLLILVIGVVLVFSAGFSWAWLIGEFQVANQKARAGHTFTDSVTGMEFVWVPAGCFQMGSPSWEDERSEDEGPVHKVCVDGFWMGKYEVTQGQWQKIMGSNPSRFKEGKNYPVENVSWNDCQEFVEKLNHRGRKTFRLPTEAEWEYACRAGSVTPFSFGATISTDQANFDGSNNTYGNGYKGVFRGSTSEVGSLDSNSFGLYDMHGNVWEWCADWYKGYYSNISVRNPQGSSMGSDRVNRGGGWSSSPRFVRSACRRGSKPFYRYNFLGFRLVSQNGASW